MPTSQLFLPPPNRVGMHRYRRQRQRTTTLQLRHERVLRLDRSEEEGIVRGQRERYREGEGEGDTLKLGLNNLSTASLADIQVQLVESTNHWPTLIQTPPGRRRQ
jgi:hypothetical protein